MTIPKTRWRNLVSRLFLGLVVAILVAACVTPPAAAATGRRAPNIVLILADDMGVGDVQALNPAGKIPTPHLDRLVREGRSFSDAHSGSAVCTPTRYGMLTGRYSWRTRLQEWVLDQYEPPLIAPDRLTLPKMLRERGYATACIGKWHLGWDWPGQGAGPDMKPDFTLPIKGGPTTRGFDYYFGTDVPNFPPFTFIEGERIVTQPTDWYADGSAEKINSGPMAPGWRFEQILPDLTNKAVQYIQARANHRAPFFLFFSMTSPHKPIAPSERFKGKSGMVPLADFVMETDWSVGQIIQALDEAGLSENTLLIFTTDNGAGAASHSGQDQLLALGHRASGPYRGYKGEIWEGGHRVPLVVRWPGVVPSGSHSDQLISLTDLMATCAAIVGATLPDNAAEDSVNIFPAFDASATTPLREALVHHDNRGNFAIRQGTWKLVILARKEGEPSFELYHLEKDVAEAHDVSARHPEIVNRMLALLDVYVTRGRSTPGSPQPNDTPDIDVRHLPKQRWGRENPKDGN